METRYNLECNDIYVYMFSLVVVVWRHNDGDDDEWYVLFHANFHRTRGWRLCRFDGYIALCICANRSAFNRYSEGKHCGQGVPDEPSHRRERSVDGFTTRLPRIQRSECWKNVRSRGEVCWNELRQNSLFGLYGRPSGWVKWQRDYVLADR